MATSTKTIRIVVNPSGAQSGAAQVSAALASIGQTGARTGASLTTSFGSAGRSVAQLGGNLNAANSNARGLAGMFGTLGQSATAAMGQMSGLGGSLASLGFAGAALGATALVGGLVALGAAAVNASAKFESYKASLTTVLGDTQKAGQAFDALTQFAAKTPFSLDQAVEGFIKLKALGLQPSERALMAYGNTASAMGMNLSQMVEAVADASTGEFERLKEFGITSKTQGDQVAFTFAGVTTKVKKNSTEIQEYLMKIGETNFAGAMERQMATFSGAMSNLEDTFTQTMAAIGDGGLTKSMGAMVNQLTTGLTTITPFLVSIGNLMSGLVSGFSAIATGAGLALGSINSGANGSYTILERLTLAVNMVGQGFSVFGTVAGAALGSIGNVVQGVGFLISDGMNTAIAKTGISFDFGTRSWSNSIIGVLRTVKYVAAQLPAIFAVAVSDTMKMFRDLGGAISALLSGDFAKAQALATKTKYSSTTKILGKVGANASYVYNDEKGAEFALNRMLGRTPKKDDGFPDPGKPPKPPGSDADKAAKAAADRAKREKDFWDTLKGEFDTARLFGIEAQKFTKERELHKILGREISAAEKLRVDGMVQSIANEKAITSLKQASFELENRNTLSRARALGLTESQAKIEDALDTKRASALNDRVDITSKAYRAEEDRFRKNLEIEQSLQNQATLMRDITNLTKEARAKRLNASVDYGTDALKNFGTADERRGLAQKEFNERIQGLKEARDVGRLSSAEFLAGTRKAGEELRDRFREIGDEFSNKVRTVSDILYRVGNAIGGKLGDLIGSISDVGDRLGSFAGTKGDISSSITKAFGDSKLTRGLGNAVGGAVAGLEIGEQVGKLSKAIGLGGQSQTGAKLGSAIGGAVFGPLGALGGGVLGSVVGSLFGKKAAQSNAVLSGADGFLSTGSNKALNKAAGSAAESIQNGLSDIAKSLGGTVGAFKVSVGQYDGDWRVSTSGQSGEMSYGKKNKKNWSTLFDFGDDQAAAISFAIKDAIADGAITGLSSFAQKALKALDVDGAISLVQQYNEITTSLDSLLDPFSASIKEITSPLDNLITQMKSVGASTDDLTKVDQYRTMKLKEALKDQLSSLNEFITSLKGAGTGVTELSRFESGMKTFEDMRSKIVSGDKSVDREAFTKLGSELFTLNTNLYGTSTAQSQATRDLFLSTAELFKTNITTAFNAAAGTDLNAATTDAIKAGAAQTAIAHDAMIQNQIIANDLARQQLAATKALQAALAAQSVVSGSNGKTGRELV